MSKLQRVNNPFGNRAVLRLPASQANLSFYIRRIRSKLKVCYKYMPVSFKKMEGNTYPIAA